MEQHIETTRQLIIEAITTAVNYVADRIISQLRAPAQEDGEQQAEQAGDLNADHEGYGEEPDLEQVEEIDIEIPEQFPEQFQEREQEEGEPGDNEWHFRIRQNGRQECRRLHQVISQV